MTARCHTDSCSIAWSEVEAGGGLTYKADFRPYDQSIECVPTDLGMRVNIDTVTPGNRLSLQADGLYSGYPAGQGIEATGYSDATADNPFIGVGIDAVDGAPAYATTYTVTNTTGSDGLLLLKGDFSLYYKIAPGIGDGDDTTGYGAAVATIGGLSNVCIYNAQIAAILTTGTTPTPTFRRIRHEFDISGNVRLPAPTGPTAEQYKSQVQSFLFAIPMTAGQALNFRGGAFYNGPAQRTNIALSGPSQANPVRGFRIEDLQAYIVPIPVN